MSSKLLTKLEQMGYRPTGRSWEGGEGVVFELSDQRVAKWWLEIEMSSFESWGHVFKHVEYHESYPRIDVITEVNMHDPDFEESIGLTIAEQVEPLATETDEDGRQILPSKYGHLRAALNLLERGDLEGALKEAKEFGHLIEHHHDVILLSGFNLYTALPELGITEGGRVVIFDML